MQITAFNLSTTASIESQFQIPNLSLTLIITRPTRVILPSHLTTAHRIRLLTKLSTNNSNSILPNPLRYHSDLLRLRIPLYLHILPMNRISSNTTQTHNIRPMTSRIIGLLSGNNSQLKPTFTTKSRYLLPTLLLLKTLTLLPSNDTICAQCYTPLELSAFVINIESIPVFKYLFTSLKRELRGEARQRPSEFTERKIKW